MSLFRNAFMSTFVNPEYLTYNIPAHQVNAMYEYLMHPLTLAFAFLGVPPRMLDGYEYAYDDPSPPFRYVGNPLYTSDAYAFYSQSWTNIFKNLIGWQNNAPVWRKVINGFLAPFAFIFNIALAVPKCAINIVKLVTEFLPSLLENAFSRIVEDSNDIMRRQSSYTEVLGVAPFSPAKIRNAKAAWFFANIGKFFFSAVRFIGRAVTSPLENAQDAFKKGESIGGSGGRILGVVLAGISVIISLGVYTLTAPMALTFIATFTPAGLATTLPTFLNIIGNFLQPAVSAVYGLLGVSGISMAYVGLSALVAGAVTTVGHGLFQLKDLIVNMWYKPKSEDASPPMAPAKPVVNQALVRQPQNASGRVDDKQAPLAPLAPQPAPLAPLAPQPAPLAPEAAPEAHEHVGSQSQQPNPVKPSGVPGTFFKDARIDRTKATTPMVANENSVVSDNRHRTF